LTPHDSKNLTAVKFFSSATPQGGSWFRLALEALTTKKISSNIFPKLM